MRSQLYFFFVFVLFLHLSGCRNGSIFNGKWFNLCAQNELMRFTNTAHLSSISGNHRKLSLQRPRRRCRRNGIVFLKQMSASAAATFSRKYRPSGEYSMRFTMSCAVTTTIRKTFLQRRNGTATLHFLRVNRTTDNCSRCSPDRHEET